MDRCTIYAVRLLREQRLPREQKLKEVVNMEHTDTDYVSSVKYTAERVGQGPGRGSPYAELSVSRPALAAVYG